MAHSLRSVSILYIWAAESSNSPVCRLRNVSLEEDSFKTSISWESPIVSLLVSPEELFEPLLGPGTIPVVSPPRPSQGGAPGERFSFENWPGVGH